MVFTIAFGGFVLDIFLSYLRDGVSRSVLGNIPCYMYGEHDHHPFNNQEIKEKDTLSGILFLITEELYVIILKTYCNTFILCDNIFIGDFSEMNNIISIENLNKSFGDVKAVQDLSFRVKEGELFAFLGVNGAGKSTTINIMCGQLSKDSGKVTVDGADLDSDADHIKRNIGVVFQNSVLDSALSVYDNLQSRAALYGLTGSAFKNRLSELIELLELKDLLKRPVGKLSGGQRRRIDIARALLNSPKILILDEPTTGLDPQTRRIIWNVISDLRKNNNMTVFLTTHYMEEAADADYVVILDSGIIAAEGTPLELKNSYTGDFITLYGVDEDAVRALGAEYEKIRDAFRLSVANTAKATELIVGNPDVFNDYEITKGKMDDVFLSVTGKKMTEEGTVK